MSASSHPLHDASDGRALECVRCGYDLRGNVSTVCPECGLAFDPRAIPPANVPWLRRAQIGSIAAYYATVWRFFVHPQDFGEQVWRVVDIRSSDALAFARFTVGVATLALSTAIVLLNSGSGRDALAQAAGAFLFVGPTAFLFFSMATLRLAIDPSRGTAVHRDRFARRQHFSCAGFALTPIVPILIALEPVAREVLHIPTPDPSSIFVFTTLGIFSLTWFGGMMFHHFGGRLSGDALAIYGFQTLLLWALSLACSFFLAAVIAGIIALLRSLP